MFYEVCQWQVRRRDSKKHLTILHELREYQKANRKSFYYTRSRLYAVDDEKAKGETWISVDEYKDQAAYDKMFKGYRSTAGAYAGFGKLRDKWETLVIPDSVKVETWIEKPEMII